ncbi:MAG TPA: CCA tRNA nucleotidyltransferase [Terriglobales bacterium]|nr:CCA tRNA nucleotidyltransferase [Terriglobales bacterium]HET7750185.1 CCA tRNA nucleotidyltransferase [Terriglobales bacterium]
MADYIYTMEIRLSPEQQRAVTTLQDVVRANEMNVYLTGGAMRDIISGFPIRDLDFTVQGNPLKLQKNLEGAGVVVQGVDDDLKTLYLMFPGNVRGEVAMARSERYDKPGKPPQIAPSTIAEDLRRRDFTINAMALSLNPGSRGLLLDPFNGAADIEAKVLRILHNYAFLEEPSRLIRATRFASRFHWPLEERTQARYDSAKENNYIENINGRAIGYEVEQLGYEEDPLHIIKALEKEGWLKVLNPHWSTAKVDTSELGQLTKTRQQMTELGYALDTGPTVLYFLTKRLGDHDISDIQKLIPRRDLVDSWRHLEADGKELAKRLTGKEAATPSRTWELLSKAKPESILFLELTTRQQAVEQKIKNFFTKWRQVQQKLPLPEMTELHITPPLPEYPKIAHDVFLMLLDGKMRSRTEILKYLKPLAPPPPPPPPPPPKRGRGAKGQVPPQALEAALAASAGKKRKGKDATAALPAVAAAAATPAGKGAPDAKSAATGKASVAGKLAAAPKPAAPAPASAAPASKAAAAPPNSSKPPEAKAKPKASPPAKKAKGKKK